MNFFNLLPILASSDLAQSIKKVPILYLALFFAFLFPQLDINLTRVTFLKNSKPLWGGKCLPKRVSFFLLLHFV